MADIFGYSDLVGTGHFANTSAAAAFKIGGSPVSLIQQWQVGYQQSVSPIYECGTPKVYYSAKHGSGTLTIGRITNKESLNYSDWGKVCSPAGSALITASEGCDGQSSVTLNLQKIILTSVGYSGQAQQAYVTENVGAMFAGLVVN